jgi:formamidopyrimidine-DNA glycosylase
MPELPDIEVYREAIERRVAGSTLARIAIRGPSVLWSVEPSPDDALGARVHAVRRLGKRVVLAVERDLFIVIHLMIAGRFAWRDGPPPPRARADLAAFDFTSGPGAPRGTLTLTEAGKAKRASIHVVRGESALAAHHAGGLDVLAAAPGDFAAAIRREDRTLKRALTDPRLLDGIGNAYSDEILHAARLSPLRRTSQLDPAEIALLHDAARRTLLEWTTRLRQRLGLDRPGPGRFPRPADVTAFRPDFAVHGRFAQPCPVCTTRVQRIVRGEHETNYCPRCQTGGKVLADRSLSRLLKDDWPARVEDWESGPPPPPA